MTFEIRTCAPEELRDFLEATEAAFGEELDDQDVEAFHRIIDVERCVYMADGNDMVGTAGAFTFSMSIPGGDLATAGVSLVGVLPSHRRKGILSELMKQQLDDIHMRREPLAALWASEGGIYGRFGYGIASLQGSIDIDRDRARFRDNPGPEGSMRLVRLDQAPKLLDPIYERVRRMRPGMHSRSEDFWAFHTLSDQPVHRRGAGPLFCAVHELRGEADAYALYRIHHDWDGLPASHLQVREALGLDATATREIWRFLFGVDLIQRIQGRSLPVDHPLHLMLQEPRRLRQTLADALWVRIVDVEPALRERSYASAERIVISIEDKLCPWNAGSWALDTRGASVVIERTEERADVALDVSDLATVYMGGFSAADLVRAGRVEESDAVDRLDAMLRTNVAPYCAGTF